MPLVVRALAFVAAAPIAVWLTWLGTAAARQDLIVALTSRGRIEQAPVDAYVLDVAAVLLFVAIAVLASMLVLGAVHLVVAHRGGWIASVSARLTPAVCRRLIAAACGVGLAAPAVAATPALADPGSAHPPCSACSTPSVRLGGLPLPDLPARLPAASATERPPVEHDKSRDRDPGSRVVVRAGDSLWLIAEHRLPGAASAAEVLRLSSRLYDLNSSVIGDDPDLILPGMTLIAPEGTS